MSCLTSLFYRVQMTGVACVLILFGGIGTAHAVSFQVNIQPIQVCMDNGTGCAQASFFEPETDKIWAQADIDINFLGTVQLNDTASLSINSTVSDRTALFAAGNAVAGNPSVTMNINMYFLDNIGGSFGIGCGASIFVSFCGNGAGDVGVLIADEVFSFNGGIGRLDTIAHEIGHVLGGLHHNTFGAGGAMNFMTSGGSRTVPNTINDIAPDGANLDQMTQAQIDQALTSLFVKVVPGGGVNPIPEPSSILLLSSGLIMFFLTRWKRSLPFVTQHT